MSIKSIIPQCFDDFVGQNEIKELLKINIDVAIKSKSSIGHILFYGSPGLGKTTLAKIVAIQSNRRFIYISGPSINKPADLISVLGNLEKNDILFVDECHRIPTNIEEILYNAIEDYKLRFFYENNENSKAIEIDLPEFTIIGATTKISAISQPLRTRFQMVLKLEDYSLNDIFFILKSLITKTSVNFKESALFSIAKASRSTPRIAKNILENAINISIAHNDSNLDQKMANYTLKMLQINENGLTYVDIKILQALKDRFNCRPTSVEAISSVINESVEDILLINEPFLVKSNYIDRTKRGRIITEKGIKCLI